MPSILPQSLTQFLDSLGRPLAGGLVTFYAQGTTTPKATYKDLAATIFNTNPVVLDASGSANIWGTGSYSMVVKTAGGLTVYSGDTTTGIYDATAVAITGGTINGTAIGGTTAAAGAFTTLVATGMNSTPIGAAFPSTGAFTTLVATSMNSTPIGGTTPAAGAFTSLSATGALTVGGTLAASGQASSTAGELNRKTNLAFINTSLADAPVTLTNAQMQNGLFTITPTVARILTTDSATNILAANPTWAAGSFYEFTITNTAAFDVTVAAASGVTVVGSAIVNNTVGTWRVQWASSSTVTVTRNATTAVTLTGAQLFNGLFTITPPTTQTLTTDTALNIIAAMPGYVVGSNTSVTIVNNSAFDVTLAAGAGVTIAGKAVTNNGSGTWRVRIDSASAVTFYNVAAAPAAAAVGGMTLLGTLTTTSGSTQTLSGLVLTTYKSLYIVVNGVSFTAVAGLSLNGVQISDSLTSTLNVFNGTIMVDLTSSIITGLIGTGPAASGGSGSVYGRPGTYTTATTSISFSGGTFRLGQILVYGVK